MSHSGIAGINFDKKILLQKHLHIAGLTRITNCGSLLLVLMPIGKG